MYAVFLLVVWFILSIGEFIVNEPNPMANNIM
jgi:hypothetical protein